MIKLSVNKTKCAGFFARKRAQDFDLNISFRARKVTAAGLLSRDGPLLPGQPCLQFFRMKHRDLN